jgi:hypothetical protein
MVRTHALRAMCKPERFIHHKFSSDQKHIHAAMPTYARLGRAHMMLHAQELSQGDSAELAKVPAYKKAKKALLVNRFAEIIGYCINQCG